MVCSGVLCWLNRACHAPLDTRRAWAEAGGMDERIDILEREVSAIKSGIAQIKSTCVKREEVRLFDGRLSRIEADMTVLKADVAVLKADVAQLKADIVRLRIEQEKIRIEMARMESRLKSWMINLAISLITVMSGIQFAQYTALKH
jgi:chromosome segregation ATPase